MKIKDTLDQINQSQTESEKNEQILIFLDRVSFVLEKIEISNERIDGMLNQLYSKIRAIRQDVNLEMGPLTII